MTEDDLIGATPEPRTRESLARDLRAAGLKGGGIVVLHTALSALGWVCGGAPAVIQALIDVMGPEGTLVMPAHTTHLTDPAQWRAPPVPPAWVETVRAQMPAFDPQTTPTRGMSAVAERLELSV